MQNSFDKQFIPNSKSRTHARLGVGVEKLVVAVVLLLGVTFCGCQISGEQALRRAAAIANIGNKSGVHVTPVRRSNVLTPVTQIFASPQTPSPRTIRLLRNYDLDEKLVSSPDAVIEWLTELVKESPRLEEIHALAEIASLQAQWSLQRGDQKRAAELFTSALLHSHQFLFDSKLDLKRNAYDPQFRSTCDVYNGALEGLLRRLCVDGQLVNGQTITIGEGASSLELSVKVEGRWKDQGFERFELVSDYETAGIENHYHTYGLGVPLIAVRTPSEQQSPEEKYYPPNLTLPMTAFCEIETPDTSYTENGLTVPYRASLRLFDPLEQQFVKNQSMTVPLESDITTPLAYHLNDPILSTGVLATATLFNSDAANEMYGMYMLEPYDPTKIPVVMVHGLWSNPVTWMRMFNDLRADSEIHRNYQFWFYYYPTGQPFWISAEQMRTELANIRRELDPGSDSPALDQITLIGHSMGGLVSQMQVMDSGKNFWNLVSSEEFDDLNGDQQSIEKLRRTFFFNANPSIDRIVMIGTPNQGSPFATAAVRWASHKVFTLPKALTNDFRKIVRDNPQIITDGTMLTTTTSIDSLASGAPVFEAMASAKRAPKVKYHSIVGSVVRSSLFGNRAQRSSSRTDGVVSYESAHTELASSEVIVPAEHSKIHQHPKCVLEVRKILVENLVEKNRIRSRMIPALPVSFLQDEEKDSETPTVSQAWFGGEVK